MCPVDKAILVNADDPGLPGKGTLLLDRTQDMTTCGQLIKHVIPGIDFKFQAVIGIGKRLAKQKARLGQRLKRGQAKIKQPGQQHRKGLRLSIGPLRAIQQMRLAPLKRHAGIKRIERKLPRCEGIRVGRIGAECRPAVLPDNAGIARDHPAAPIEIGALQNTGAIAIGILGGQKHRVAMPERMRPIKRLGGQDILGVCGQTGVIQKGREIGAGESGIGDLIALQECPFDGLDHQMVMIRRSLGPVLLTQFAQYSHGHERRQSLRWRGRGEKSDVTIIKAHRIDRSGTGFCKVRLGDRRSDG